MAFTYNDPVIFLEYAVDVAAACRDVGVKTVAVTAGYIGAVARPEFFATMDATNIDLKGTDGGFLSQALHRLARRRARHSPLCQARDRHVA